MAAAQHAAELQAVEQAITALYTSAAAADANAANQWLLAYTATPGAWAAYPALLTSSPHAEVRFFAANALYHKVRAAWGGLRAPQEREGVVAHLWATLEGAGAGADVAVQRRLCLALAAATVQTPGELPAFYSRFAALAGRVLASGDASEASVRALLVCTEALAAAAELGTEMQLPPGAREALARDLAAVAPGVLQLLHALLARPESPASVAAALRPGAPAAVCAALLGALNCFRAWALAGSRAAPATKAFTLAALRAPGVLLAAVDLLAATGEHASASGASASASATLASAAVSAVTLVLADAAGLELEAKHEALTAVALRALAGLPALRAACAPRAPPAPAYLCAWGELLEALCREGEWLATGGGGGCAALQPAALGGLPLGSFRFALAAADAGSDGAPVLACGGVPMGVGVLLADAVLALAASPRPPLAAFFALEVVQTLGVGERHPFVRHHAHAALALVLVGQFVDPRARGAAAAAAAAEALSDREAWLDLRKLWCKDALVDCAYVL